MFPLIQQNKSWAVDKVKHVLFPDESHILESYGEENPQKAKHLARVKPCGGSVMVCAGISCKSLQFLMGVTAKNY